jgi:hypothetical protein
MLSLSELAQEWDRDLAGQGSHGAARGKNSRSGTEVQHGQGAYGAAKQNYLLKGLGDLGDLECLLFEFRVVVQSICLNIVECIGGYWWVVRFARC